MNEKAMSMEVQSLLIVTVLPTRTRPRAFISQLGTKIDEGKPRVILSFGKVTLIFANKPLLNLVVFEFQILVNWYFFMSAVLGTSQNNANTLKPFFRVSNDSRTPVQKEL